MASSIPERLAQLRPELAARDLDAYLVPSSDEHLNEYLPLWRTRREFLSGFTGSAGDLLVGQEDAWLFADGRYHLQAESELAGTGITPMKVGVPGVNSLTAQLRELARAKPGLRVGVDPMVLPLSVAEILASALEGEGGQLVEVFGNLVDPLWPDRPSPSSSRLLELPSAWSGASPVEKLATVREDLAGQGAKSLVAVKLDQIAWLFNLRSSDDVPYNPVFESFLIIEPERVRLYLRGATARLPEGFAPLPGLEVLEYDAFTTALPEVEGPVQVDPSGVTRGVTTALVDAGVELVQSTSPLEARKAVKNEAEREAVRRANLHASVAKTRALLWLRREIAAGRTVTEASFRDHLEGLYAERPDYHGLSFNTISATGPHGAIIHYGACDDTPLEKGHLFLIDSGAHIGGGTTDDTRTVAVDRCDDEARRVYTRVLKGHVNAARQRIPDGTTGSALDALARAPLWSAGLNYDHGTGHGVGAFLCVHEGPFAISERTRKSHAHQPLREGHVSSIEPGYYRPGWGGVRIENLYLYVPSEAEGGDEGRRWLELEPLTWIPFDPALIDTELLDRDERAWLDRYHAECVKRLSPHLSEEERGELAALIG